MDSLGKMFNHKCHGLDVIPVSEPTCETILVKFHHNRTCHLICVVLHVFFTAKCQTWRLGVYDSLMPASMYYGTEFEIPSPSVRSI